MNEQEVQKIFSDYRVLLDGHFVLTSDRHASIYVNKNAIYPHVKVVKTLCHEIASRAIYLNIDIVVAPVIGGMILSQWVAYWLTIELEKEVLAIYAEKKGNEKLHRPLGSSVIYREQEFIFNRGYRDFLKDKRVLVVDDVLTTGGSVRSVVKDTRVCGGEVVGVGALCNRGRITADTIDVLNLFSLIELDLESFEKSDCPLCKAEIPINIEIGKGLEFLMSKSG